MQTRDEINCFYKITFPGEKEKLLFRELIKREILTSLEVLCTKLVRVISLCFAKRCFPKYGFFSLKMSAQAKKKLTQHVSEDFSSFNNKVSLTVKDYSMKYTLYYAHVKLKAVKRKRFRGNTGIPVVHLSTVRWNLLKRNI